MWGSSAGRPTLRSGLARVRTSLATGGQCTPCCARVVFQSKDCEALRNGALSSSAAVRSPRAWACSRKERENLTLKCEAVREQHTVKRPGEGGRRGEESLGTFDSLYPRMSASYSNVGGRTMSLPQGSEACQRLGAGHKDSSPCAYNPRPRKEEQGVSAQHHISATHTQPLRDAFLTSFSVAPSDRQGTDSAR